MHGFCLLQGLLRTRPGLSIRRRRAARAACVTCAGPGCIHAVAHLPVPPRLQGKKGGRGKKAAAKPAAGGRKGGAGGKGNTAATPVAVPNASVGLTPGSALLAPKSTGSRLATGAGAASTAARPPRPTKTPGSAATGGSLARLLGQGTPAGGAGAPACASLQAACFQFARLPGCSCGFHPAAASAHVPHAAACAAAPACSRRPPQPAPPANFVSDGEAPGSALREELAPRFSDRTASAFPFLHPDRIRDAEQRRPDHPE